MKAYITRYALTQGILEVEGELSERYATMFCCKRTGFTSQNYHGSDWHLTLEAAQAHAEKMVAKKIVSLTKSLAQLKNYKPKVVIQ